MAALNQEQLQELRTLLQRLQQELQEQMQLSKSATAAVTLDQTLVGRVSRMDALQQQSVALSTKEKAQTRLRRVNIALAAMESGDYGYCARCDAGIGFGRLSAQPEARLCIACQDMADRQ